MNSIRLDKISLNIALSLLVGVFSIFMLTSLGFILGLSINLSYTLLAIVAMVYLPAKIDSFTYQERLVSFIITLIIIASSGYISSRFMDYSYDGQWYHQSEIIFLKKGWNPIYEKVVDFLSKCWNIDIGKATIWIEHYPRFSEIFAANIFYLTDNIETGKMLNTLSMSILFFYSFYILNIKFPQYSNSIKFLLSITFACSPIALAQIHTYYVDGLMYNYFILLLLAIIEMENSNKELRTSFFVFITSVVILSHLKVGGFLYSIVILIVCKLHLIISKKKELSRYLNYNILAIIFLVFLLGINPYMTNIGAGKHIFYPVIGQEKIDVVSHVMPKQFVGKSMPYKLFMSTFSKVDNIGATVEKENIELKLPFTVQKSELENLVFWDTRLCGFGIFWSGILLLAILLCGVISWKDKSLKECKLIMTMLLICTILNPENWWARYVPQLYALPIFVALCCLQKKHIKLLQIVIRGYLLLILTNSLVVYYKVHEESTVASEYKINFLNDLKENTKMTSTIKEGNYIISEPLTSTMLLFGDKCSE